MIYNLDKYPGIRPGSRGVAYVYRWISMRPKRYIVWSTDEVDLDDPFQKVWFIKQVLTHGRAEDVAALDWDEVRTLIPELELPGEIAALWEDYFNAVK
jgi:hypothetical protein